MSLFVTATARVEGLHHWPQAPAHRAYLRDLHRHQFHAAATVQVDHAGRDVEFHDLQDDLHRELTGQGEPYHDQSRLLTFGAASCEALAAILAACLTSLGYTVESVEVSEDGEHTSTWSPE